MGDNEELKKNLDSKIICDNLEDKKIINKTPVLCIGSSFAVVAICNLIFALSPSDGAEQPRPTTETKLFEGGYYLPCVIVAHTITFTTCIALIYGTIMESSRLILAWLVIFFTHFVLVIMLIIQALINTCNNKFYSQDVKDSFAHLIILGIYSFSITIVLSHYRQLRDKKTVVEISNC